MAFGTEPGDIIGPSNREIVARGGRRHSLVTTCTS